MSDNKLSSFFITITAEVLYDKELNPIEKLIFAEISALTNKEGYCFASNKHFANVFNRNETTVSTIINKLAKKEYVEIEMNKEGNSRKIFLNYASKIKSPPLKNQKPPFEKSKAPPFEKSKHSNTIESNTNSNTISTIEKNAFSYPTVEEVIQYSISKNNTPELAERFYNYYNNNKWYDSNGKPMQNWKLKFDKQWIKKNPSAKPAKQFTTILNEDMRLSDNEKESVIKLHTHFKQSGRAQTAIQFRKMLDDIVYLKELGYLCNDLCNVFITNGWRTFKIEEYVLSQVKNRPKLIQKPTIYYTPDY